MRTSSHSTVGYCFRSLLLLFSAYIETCTTIIIIRIRNNTTVKYPKTTVSGRETLPLFWIFIQHSINTPQHSTVKYERNIVRSYTRAPSSGRRIYRGNTHIPSLTFWMQHQTDEDISPVYTNIRKRDALRLSPRPSLSLQRIISLGLTAIWILFSVWAHGGHCLSYEKMCCSENLQCTKTADCDRRLTLSGFYGSDDILHYDYTKILYERCSTNINNFGFFIIWKICKII